MKKLFLYAALAVLGTFCSCNPDQLEVEVSPVTKGGEKVSLIVHDEIWTEGDTKSAYYPDVKQVRLTGEEMLKLIYYKDKLYNTTDGIKATKDGENYSFSMPDEAADATNWYGIMPYTKNLVGLDRNSNRVSLRLGPVQFPEANSFDPMCDYLVSKPFEVTGAEDSKTAEITAFKRLFTPLCLSIGGLPTDAKIYTLTLSFSQEPTSAAALSGLFYAQLDPAYSNTRVTSIASNSMGNAISAEYGSGLEAVDGRWPVWFIVNPITIESGGDMTVSLSTKDKTYTRTVTLGQDIVIGRDQLNRIKFNIAGEGYSVVESVTQDFANHTLSGTETLTASNGASLEWVTTTEREQRSSDDGDSGLKGAMRLINQHFIFPSIPGKIIKGARIFTHPGSRSRTDKDIYLTVGGTDNYNYSLSRETVSESMAYKGGAIDISLPAGQSSLSGLTVSTTDQLHLISAITLFTEDAAIDPDDYYAQYEAGKDITINDVVFNKATNGAARLVKLYANGAANELVNNYKDNGILFLDYDAADGQEDVLALGYRLQPQNVVIIGRYRNHQPHIDLATNGTFGVQSKGAEIHLKNVKLSTGNWMFVTSNLDGTTNLDVNIEDCTLNSTNTYLFVENHASSRFRSIVINNSILKLTKSLYEAKSDVIAAGSTLSIEKLWVTNSVVYAASEVSYPTIAMRISSSGVWYTPNLDLKLDHNTFYNLTNNNLGLVGLGSVSKFSVTYCICDATLPKNSPIVMMHAAHDPAITEETGAVRHNYFNDRSGSYQWTYFYSQTGTWGIKASGNVFSQAASLFVSTDATNGYFPVNAEVVTGDTEGAGASYDTKLWKTWE